MAIDVTKFDDKGLENFIQNHREAEATDRPEYQQALEELARRKGHGLDFDKSFRAIRQAAIEQRFMSYGELAEQSGSDWSKVRYAMNDHLGNLVEFAYRNGWPLLSAIVVNQNNLNTGELDVPQADHVAARRGQVRLHGAVGRVAQASQRCRRVVGGLNRVLDVGRADGDHERVVAGCERDAALGTVVGVVARRRRGRRRRSARASPPPGRADRKTAGRALRVQREVGDADVVLRLVLEDPVAGRDDVGDGRLALVVHHVDGDEVRARRHAGEAGRLARGDAGHERSVPVSVAG